MKTFKELLITLSAPKSVREWVADMTIEEAVTNCHRGDWLLMLAQELNIGLQPITLAKGHCANTVSHLMTDERSHKAVDTAIAYGEGKATLAELKAASDAAAYAAAAYFTYAVYTAAAVAAYAAADAAAYAAAAAAAAYAAAAAADAAAAAYADFAAAYAANRLKTADICRQYIGQLIIDKVNELLN